MTKGAEDILNESDPYELRNLIRKNATGLEASLQPPASVVVGELPSSFPVGSDKFVPISDHDPLALVLTDDVGDVTTNPTFGYRILSYETGTTVSTGSVNVTSATGTQITGLTPWAWYALEGSGGPWHAGGAYMGDYYDYALSDDGATFSGRVGLDAVDGFLTVLPDFAALVEEIDAYHGRVYFQASGTSVWIRCSDSSFGDNSGSLGYTLKNATVQLDRILVNDVEYTKLTLPDAVHDATEKTTPIDADELPVWDSVTNLINKVPFSDLKATLKSYFDTLYAASTFDVEEDTLSTPPTATELTTVLGSAVTRGAGFAALIKSAITGALLYLVVSDGIRWYYHAMTGARIGDETYAIVQLDTRHITGDTYSGGIALGNLSTADGLELVAAAGNGLAGASGHVTAYDATGATLWTWETTPQSFPMSVAIGDVDGDGNNEIAVSYQTPVAGVYLLDKDGNDLWGYGFVGGGYGRAVAIGKVDPGVTGNQVVVGGYNGQFALLDKDGNEIWRNTLGSYTVQTAVIADTDADGQNEIIIPYDRYLRKYDHTGTQVWSVTLGSTPNDVLDVAVGNVTSATGLEIAAAVHPRYGVGSVRGTYLFNKDGTELWHWDPPGGSAFGCTSVIFADVNGDGQKEVIVGYDNDDDGGDYGTYAGGIAILDNAGAELAILPLSRSVGFLHWGDVNNDGESELLMSSEGTVYIYRIAADASVSQIGRVTGYEDTQANVEADTGTLAEISFARDSSNGNIGVKVGSTWHWIDVTPAPVGQYRELVWEVSGDDLDFLTDAGEALYELKDLE